MELTECINFMLTSAQNSVFTYFKSRLQPFDVTPVQYALLKCLWTRDMQTPTQLSQGLNIDASSVTGILARLEKKELLERTFSTEDRRSVYVRLLPDGKALQPGIEAVIDDANANILSGLTPESVALFKQQLRQIEQNAETALESVN